MIPKLNPKHVVPQNNWVVIKPSQDVFRIVADNNGLTIDTTWTPWLYPVIHGEIVAVPEKLEYFDFQSSLQIAKDNREILSDRLSYKTTMDVKIGDEVYYNYIAADNAIKMSRLFEWDKQIYMFVRYDLLLGVIRKGDFKSINGWIYYEKIETQTRNKHAEGSVLYDGQSNSLGLGSKLYRRQTGIVKSISYIEEYFWHSNPKQRDYYQPANMIKLWDCIMFDYKSDLKLENDAAKISDISWRRVQDKDVMGWTNISGEFEPYKSRILVKPDPEKTKLNGLVLPENKRIRPTEGEVVKVSDIPTGTWFDDIKPGMRVKYNVNDPKLLVWIGEEDFICLRPQNIIHFQ